MVACVVCGTYSFSLFSHVSFEVGGGNQAHTELSVTSPCTHLQGIAAGLQCFFKVVIFVLLCIYIDFGNLLFFYISIFYV